jgi:periplasmic protein TonB
MNSRNVLPKAAADGLVRWLIQHSARSAPPALSERLEEEWLADLGARSGAVARLRFALGCCWATRVIAYEHSTATVLAVGSKAGSKTMTAYAQHDFSFVSRRTLALLAIIGLHVIVIYGLASGLARSFIRAIPQVMQGEMLQDPVKHVEPPPQLSEPHFTPRPFVITERDIKIDEPPDTSGIQAPVVGPTEQQALAPPPVAKSVRRVQGGPGKGFPNTEDYYPPSAIRLGQAGLVIVSVCVDDRGLLTAAPTLARSSGFPSLDQGALKLAKAGSGHYRASTEDGRPVDSCYPVGFRYDLHDRGM